MKNIVGLVMTLAVGVIMIGTLLAPVVSSMTPETLVYHNEGSYFAAPDGENHTIVFSENYATVDGVQVEYPVGFGTGNNRNATVIIGENWMFRLDSNMLRLVIAGPNDSFVNMGAVTSDITVTISGDTLTYTYNNVDTTLTDLKYYLASDGDMVLCYNPYITEDSLIVGGIRNNNNAATADFFEIVTGTVADGFTSTVCRAYIFTASPTTGSATTTETAVTDSITTNLLQLTKITQNVTFWNDATAEITLTYVLAPAEVVYDNPNYVNSAVSAILPVITIITIISLVAITARSLNRD